jgi:serine/threonine protein kinase
VAKLGGTSELCDLVAIGSVLAGKYRIERIVGTGGMGVVALARHLRLEGPVAVKFMLPRRGDSERTPARFLKEARTASRITSPHVARVFDVDLRDDGVPFIVMEYLEGETLASALRKSGPLAVEEMVDDVLAVCEALTEAHSLGIVHRDLKPANLFRARASGRSAHVLKVLDFGISKTFEESDQAVSTTGGAFIGSPPYMSPEQLTFPAEVDARTDIWSLGVVLYECLTGRSPFLTPSIAATCSRILHERPAPPSTLRPDLPAGLDACVLKCLEKTVEARFSTIRELARALAPFGGPAAARSLASIASLPEPIAPRPTAETITDKELAPTATEGTRDPTSSLEGVMRTRTERPGLRLGAALAGVLAVGAGALIVIQRPRNDDVEGVSTESRGAPPAHAANPVPTSTPDETPPVPTAAREVAVAAAGSSAPPQSSAIRPPSKARPASPRPTSPPSSLPEPPPRPAATPTVTAPPADPEAIYVDRK